MSKKANNYYKTVGNRRNKMVDKMGKQIAFIYQESGYQITITLTL